MGHTFERLKTLRQLLKATRADALIVPRADEYLGEYLPEHNERLLWMTGFTGSAGVAILTAKAAAIFVDGRYTVQVRSEVCAEHFEYHSLVDEPHAQWLAQILPEGARVMCDPRLHSFNWYRSTSATLEAEGIELVADPANLIDRCWHDRPAPRVEQALLLAECYTGASSYDKRQQIASSIAEQKADAALIFAPDTVSWLLNVRGTDIPCLPVLQAFAILEADGRMTVVTELARIPEGFAQHVGQGVEARPPGEAEAILSGFSGKTLLADPDTANAWTQLTLERAGATLLASPDPVLIPKACKNAVEVNGAREAHKRDAVSLVQFLAWLDDEVAGGNAHDEASLADQLYAFRQGNEAFHGSSFDTISAAGSNAAMCHYNHLNAVPAPLPMDSLYLVDSGAQYLEGTTDVTRTVAIGDPGEDACRMFTLVLKGHIALDQACFPVGTTGTQLDALARQFLWQQGFDYDHGTGHGVGAFLSVHEGPQRISKAWNSTALAPGMIVSNEPGYYRDGAFGIRCENLLVVIERADISDERSMLGFDALTLAPFDQRLLQRSLLTDSECQWLNNYHQRVRETIGPLLSGADLGWLEAATEPLD